MLSVNPPVSGRAQTHALLILLAIIIAASGIRVICALHKSGYHVDEFATVSTIKNLSNKQLEEFIIRNDGKWLTGDELTDLTFSVSTGNYWRDLRGLFIMEGITAHPNLHYLLFRAGLIFDLQRPGLAYNLYSSSYNFIFFTISALFLFLLLSQFAAPYEALFCVAIYSFTPAAVDGTLYFRMYEQLTALLTITAYLLVRINSKEKPVPGDYIAAGAAMSAAFLTHYHSFIFTGLILSLICFIHLSKRNYRRIVYLFLLFAGSLAGAQLFYHKLIPNLFGGHRAKQAFGSFSALSKTNTLKTISQLWRTLNDIFSGHFAVFLLLLAALTILWVIRKKTVTLKSAFDPRLISLSAIALMYMGFVLFTSQMKSIRYCTPVLPFLAASQIITARLMHTKTMTQAYLAAVTVLSIIVSFPVKYLLPGEAPRAVPWAREKLIFLQNPSAPVYLFIFESWRTHAIFPLLDSGQKYHIEYKPASVVLPDQRTGEAYLVVDQVGWSRKKIDPAAFQNTAGWEIAEQKKFYTFSIYRLKTSQH